MRIKFDKEADTLYFRLDEKKIVESEEISPGIVLDYDDSDQVIGVMLNECVQIALVSF